MAGLVTARILSDYFDKVVVIERDNLPRNRSPRKSVPQGQHIHNLLARADEILERLFPGLFDDLLERGAVKLDWSADTRWHHHGVWKVNGQSGVESYFMSRPLLEWRVRAHLQERPNVEIRPSHRVTELLTNEAKTAVTGIAFESTKERGTRQLLYADLVVDNSGRGSRVVKWLEALGYPEPPISIINVDVVYATRIFRPKSMPEWKALLILAPPPEKRSGGIFTIEDDQWMVTLFGYHGDHPPADNEGWLKFAKSFCEKDIYEAIANAEPVTDVVTHRFPHSQWRHFEKMAHFPDNLIVLGDAVSSFNPIYGQGMTSATLQAEVLETELSKRTAAGGDLTGLSQSVQKEIAKVVAEPWQAVASEDFRYAETTGDKMPAARFINWYSRRVHRAAQKDLAVMKAFLRVMHMQAKVPTLFAPNILFRVLRSA
jgi:2-polyprenyl-6-methoxyphenol hydroxylase-like FAD-dependent oxidoreductase